MSLQEGKEYPGIGLDEVRAQLLPGGHFLGKTDHHFSNRAWVLKDKAQGLPKVGNLIKDPPQN